MRLLLETWGGGQSRNFYKVFIYANFVSGHENTKIKTHKNTHLQKSCIINVDRQDEDTVYTVKLNYRHFPKTIILQKYLLARISTFSEFTNTNRQICEPLIMLNS